MPRTVSRFHGRIAGFGTGSGVRLVVGMWPRSPLGSFADVMVERADGHRILLAPSDAVAEFVGATYVFDEVRIVPVAHSRSGREITVAAGPLNARFTIGTISPLGRLLRLVPRGLATRPGWLRLIDPVARVLVPGARTAGSAGQGRREYYGVTSARAITGLSASWDGDDLGALQRLHPPVRFGFGSAPAAPHIVEVVTTIVERVAD
jgi:hypothetical protein